MTRLSAIVGLCLLALAGTASAQSGVDITFTPGTAQGWDRTISATYAGVTTFGTILIGSSSVSASPIVITNMGHVATSLAVTVSSPATDTSALNQPWALSTSTSTGTDTYAMFGVFQSTSPTNNGYYADALHRVPDTSAPQCASDISAGTPAEHFKGGQSGVRVPPTGIVDLWMILYPPTRSSNLKNKLLQVTVTTGACD